MIALFFIITSAIFIALTVILSIIHHFLDNKLSSTIIWNSHAAKYATWAANIRYIGVRCLRISLVSLVLAFVSIFLGALAG